MIKQTWACLEITIGGRKRPRKLSLIIMCVIACGFILVTYWKLIASLKVSHKSAKNFYHVNCDNLLTNLTRGEWVLTSQNQTLKRILDELLRHYWINRGIQFQGWRKDGMCGYKNFNEQPPGSSWPRVGSWCDPDGKTPCCSNFMKGTCQEPNPESCECKNCVDMRAYKHDEMSRWKVGDERCTWNMYSVYDACDVIEKSDYAAIYYVGDSFLRNMFHAMMVLLSTDPQRATWTEAMTSSVREKCVPRQINFWKECRKILESSDELLHREAFCGGRRVKFKMFMKPYYDISTARDFLNLVEQLLGKKGSLIILSVGFHMECSAGEVINRFLDPALQKIRSYYSDSRSVKPQWPRLLFSLPMPTSLLKPFKHLHLQSNHVIDGFASLMSVYCKLNSIPVLDFRSLGKNLISFDGVHYGLTANLMKNQILLNYIAGNQEP